MMQNGLTFPVLSDALRRLYVEIAVSDLLPDPKARTDSRISLLTGVHRKEIRRMREMPVDMLETPNIVTLGSQIVARWAGTDPFTDADGRPRPLSRISNEMVCPRPSFDELVASVTTDIHPRAVLDNLLGHEMVFMDAQDRVQLNVDAFTPQPGDEEQLLCFARNLHDHVAAAVANISMAGAPPFLDRSVHYDRLTSSQVQALREYAGAAAMRVLLDVNRLAQELTQAGPGSNTTGSTPAGSNPAKPQRINFGTYAFDDDERPVGGGA